MVDAIAISSSSTRREILAKMARCLAYRLDLNYFDSDDISRFHVTRHTCPYNVHSEIADSDSLGIEHIEIGSRICSLGLLDHSLHLLGSSFCLGTFTEGLERNSTCWIF